MPTSSDGIIEITLPPRALLDSLPDGVARGCTYTLRDAEHILRHALSILVVIKGVVVQEARSQASLLYGQGTVWFLDALQNLSAILINWPTPLGVSLAPVLQASIDVVEAYKPSCSPDSALYHKGCATLSLVCAEFFHNPTALLAEDEDGVSLRRTLCFALVHLAGAVADHAPTSRLTTSGLLPLAHRLISENPVIGAGTDVWVRSSYLSSQHFSTNVA